MNPELEKHRAVNMYGITRHSQFRAESTPRARAGGLMIAGRVSPKTRVLACLTQRY